MNILLQALILVLAGLLAYTGATGPYFLLLLGGIALCALLSAGVSYQGKRNIDDLLHFVEEMQDNTPATDNDNNIERIRNILTSLRSTHRATAEKTEREISALRSQMQSLQSDIEISQQEAREAKEQLAQSAPVLKKAHGVCQQLSSEVRRLSELVNDVDKGVEIQHIRLGETGAAMENVADAAHESARRVIEVAENAEASRSQAVTGEQEVHGAVDSIETVKGTILHLKDAMADLGQKASNIGQVMNVINEVADQTNLLALNAAIEAARAGEAGRGFAVVADEVRKLAEKTMGATKEVEDAVHAIQEETRRNVETVEEAANLTVESAERASRAGIAMREILDGMEATTGHLKVMAQSAEEQSDSSARTNAALEDLRHVAQQTASHMEVFTGALLSFKSGMEEMDMIVNAMVTGDYSQAASDKLVQWTPKLDLHIPMVDSQHRQLCDYINELYFAMKNNRTGQELKAIMGKLRDYTAKHFQDEEGLFEITDYPGVKEHKAIHRKFVEKLNTCEAQLGSGTAAVSMDLLTFLKDWLIQHIAGTDTTYLPYVKK